jgi:uncharacterized cupredoxin-like copper-binding protein
MAPRSIPVLVAAITLVVLSGAVAVAQTPGPEGGTPAPAPSLFPPVPGGHPAHVHVGLCPQPGDIAWGLSHVSDQMLVDGTSQAGSPVGAPTARPVLTSVTTVPADLATLADGNHSINVHLSDEDMGTYIACGDIGGTTSGGTELAFWLAEQNDSGFNGVAQIHDRGDGTSTVSIFLRAGPAVVDVTTQEYAVVPAQDSVAAGRVTFKVTNQGPDDEHEFVVVKTDLAPDALPTKKNGSVDEEGAGIEIVDEIEPFAPGKTKRLTVDLAPGSYVLLCNVVLKEDGGTESHYQEGMRTAFTVE